MIYIPAQLLHLFRLSAFMLFGGSQSAHLNLSRARSSSSTEKASEPLLLALLLLLLPLSVRSGPPLRAPVLAPDKLRRGAGGLQKFVEIIGEL